VTPSLSSSRPWVKAIRRCVAPGIIGSGGGRPTVRPCAGIALLHGPPGTGKTRTLVGAVSALLLCRPTPRILVCTPSNAAVDELAMRLHSGLLAADGSEVGMRPGELVRVGPLDQVASRAHPLTLDALTEHRLGKLAGGAVGGSVGGGGVGGAAGVRGAGARGSGARGAGGAARGGDAEARERRGVLKSAQVVAATTTAAGAAFLASLEFDAVVIDEAAQASESAALIPLMNQGAAVKRVILAGDHRQLPATAHGLDPAKRQAYETSLFERLQVGGEGGRGRHPVVSLTEQHRMHRQIAQFPAKHFYGGRLDNSPGAPSRSPFRGGGGGGGDEGDGGGGGSGGDGMTLSDGQATVSSGGYMIHLAPYAFLDWRGAEQSGARGASRRSISNPSEAHVAQGLLIASTRLKLCSDDSNPRVCMSIHTEGKSCSDLDRVLVLSDLPARWPRWWRRRGGTLPAPPWPSSHRTRRSGRR